MEKRKGLISVIAIIAIVGVGSQVVLDSLFGGGQVTTSTKKIGLENYGNLLSIDNDIYPVTSAYVKENIVKLTYSRIPVGKARVGENEPLEAPQATTTSVSRDAYETAKQTPRTVLVFKEMESRTESPVIWPFSASLGIIAGAIFIGIVLTRQEIRGNAASMLLEEGLESLSVRDAEIVGQIMLMEEFTIPQIMQKAGTSKITTWRTIKKLVEKGLVRETDRTRAPSRGLGGRGKPSKVYEFVGGKEG